MYTRTWCRSRQTSQAKKPLITWEHFDHCMSSKPAPMLALRRVQPSKFGLDPRPSGHSQPTPRHLDGAAAGLPHAALPARSSPANSVADLVADPQQVQADAAHDSERATDDHQAQPRRHVARAEEPVTKPVDHVEERVEVADLAPD